MWFLILSSFFFNFHVSFFQPSISSFRLTVCSVELSSVLAASSQSVKLGLMSLCPPDWQRRGCDRPERHRSPIRSTALINLFKQTGEKLSAPFRKPLKRSREGTKWHKRGGVQFYQHPGTWVFCICVYVCLCGGQRRLWGSVFTVQVGQEWEAFWRIPDVSNLTSDLCVLSSVRDYKHRF